MSVVAVEIVTEAPSPAMTRAMLDACSAGVRVGTCELSSDAAGEPELATAVVRWSSAPARSVRIDVSVPSVSGRSHLRVLTFKDSDAPVERWRAVGLTIATLVGDALAPSTATGQASFDDPNAAARTNAAARASNPGTEKHPAGEVAAPRGGSPESEHRDGPPTPTGDEHMTTERPLPKTLWVCVSGVTGPGLEEGPFRFGARADVGFRPLTLPVFGRVAFGYTSRAEDSRGVSVQWEDATLEAGLVVGASQLRLEPHLGAGVQNVHAHATDPATKRSDSGNELDVSFHLGFDGVFQLDRFALVASVDGWQNHAATRIIVQNREIGTSPATSWAGGLGVRYYVK